MTAIFYRPSGWANKPSQVPSINWTHPLARGLVFCATPLNGLWHELVSGQTVVHPGTNAIRASSDGNKSASWAAVGANGAGGQFAQATGLDTLVGACSLFVEGSLEVNATEGRMFRSREGTNGHGVGFSFDDASVVYNGFIYWAENGNRASFGNIFGTNSEQFTHRALVTADGTNARLYAKGALAGTVATAVVPVADAARRTTVLGVNNSQGSGSASILMAWSRVLGIEEYLLLHVNPWQLLVRRNAQMIVLPAAGGGATEALSGSAVTGGSGTQAPGHSIGL